MIARSISRRREVGIRVALGASASRIVRQLLTESFVLASVAGVAGTVLAWFALSALISYAGVAIPPWAQPRLDAPAVAFAVLTIGAATLLFGLAPALQLRRHAAAQAGTASARAAGSVPERRMLNALVVTEVALAAVLLVSGGLLVRAYRSLHDVTPGFATEGVATFRVALARAAYPNGTEQLNLYSRLLDRLRAIPGVTAAGAITCLPLSCHSGNFYVAEGEAPLPPGVSDPVTLVRIATPGYFATMGIELTKGRFFTEGEGSSGRYGRVAVVNEEFAALHWPNADPIGKRIATRGDTSRNWMTVVGVVKDVRHYGLVEPMIPGIYVSITALDSTSDRRALGFAVRTNGDAGALLPAIRAAARQVDPELPLYEVGTTREALERSMTQQRLIATSLAVMSAVALALAIGGIYAVLSYVVGRRRREIAIRMALGAKQSAVLRLIMRQGFALSAIGLVIGVPLALAAARGISTILLGISPQDPKTYLVAITVVVLTGALAALIPAAHAARTDAKIVLRD
jgi:predicted permease